MDGYIAERKATQAQARVQRKDSKAA